MGNQIRAYRPRDPFATRSALHALQPTLDRAHIYAHLCVLFHPQSGAPLHSPYVPNDLLQLIADMAEVDCNPQVLPFFQGTPHQLFRVRVEDDLHWVSAATFCECFRFVVSCDPTSLYGDSGPPRHSLRTLQLRASLVAQGTDPTVAASAQLDASKADPPFSVPDDPDTYRKLVRVLLARKEPDVIQIEPHRNFEVLDATDPLHQDRGSELFLLQSFSGTHVSLTDGDRFYVWIRAESHAAAWRYVLVHAEEESFEFLDTHKLARSFGRKSMAQLREKPPTQPELSKWLSVQTLERHWLMPYLQWHMMEGTHVHVLREGVDERPVPRGLDEELEVLQCIAHSLQDIQLHPRLCIDMPAI